jgi:hypothetical protein
MVSSVTEVGAMHQRYRRRYEMLTRVRAFGATHGHLFPENSTAHAAFAVVATELDQLQLHDVEAREAARLARGGPAKAARQAFVEVLTRADATARLIAAGDPSFTAHIDLSLPKDDLTLLTTARLFAGRIGPWTAQFAAHGLDRAELDEHIRRFGDAMDARNCGRSDTAGVRAKIEAAFACAMHAVATVDVAVANHCGSNAVVVTMWQHVKRLGYVHRPRRAGTGTALAAGQQVIVARGPGQAVSVDGNPERRAAALFGEMLTRFFSLRFRRAALAPPVEAELIASPLEGEPRMITAPARKTPRLLGR